MLQVKKHLLSSLLNWLTLSGPHGFTNSRACMPLTQGKPVFLLRRLQKKCFHIHGWCPGSAFQVCLMIFEQLIDLHHRSKMIPQAAPKITSKENCKLEKKIKGEIRIPFIMNGNILRYPWHFSANIILYYQRNITIATVSNVQYILLCTITIKAIIPQISWGRNRYLAIAGLVELSPGHLIC